MAFVKIENNIVVEKVLSEKPGYVEAPDGVICGQVLMADGTYENPAMAVASIEQQILDLEILQTPRRMREAALTQEGAAWLSNLESQIASLRAQLP